MALGGGLLSWTGKALESRVVGRLMSCCLLLDVDSIVVLRKWKLNVIYTSVLILSVQLCRSRGPACCCLVMMVLLGV